MAAARWFRLRSGGLYRGAKAPPGSTPADPPDREPVDPVQAAAGQVASVLAGLDGEQRSAALALVDELVESGERGGAVGADVASVDLAAEPAEVGDVEVSSAEPPADDDPDGVVGQEDKPTRTRTRGKGGQAAE